mgnify:CR=1 FL=1
MLLVPLCTGHVSHGQAPPLNLFQNSAALKSAGSNANSDDSESDAENSSSDSDSDSDSDDENASKKILQLTANSSSEDVNAFRNRLQIKVKGSRVPAPIVQFHEADLPSETLSVVLRNIEASDWKEPTPIQMQSIPVLTGGRDLLASAPTVSKDESLYLPVVPSLLINEVVILILETRHWLHRSTALIHSLYVHYV